MWRDPSSARQADHDLPHGPLAASADREIGLQFLDVCLIGNIALLLDLGLLCRARRSRLACLLSVAGTYGEAIGTGLL